MYVLLIEDGNLEGTKSLLAPLEEQGYQTYLAHTMEMAVKQAATVWPNLVIFNPATGFTDLAGFQRAIDKTVLDLPHIVIGDSNHLDDEIDKDTILVGPNKPQLFRGKAVMFAIAQDLLLLAVHNQTGRSQEPFLLFGGSLLDDL